jgi:death-on-curing protein
VRGLTVSEVLALHRRVIDRSGGAHGVRDMAALASAVAAPFQTFDGADLYPTLIEKAAALGFFLVRNHPFIDGNKRIGHASLEVLLVLNGFELLARVDEQEQVMLALADGQLTREQFTRWVNQFTVPRSG